MLGTLPKNVHFSDVVDVVNDTALVAGDSAVQIIDDDGDDTFPACLTHEEGCALSIGCSVDDMADDTYPICLKDEDGRRLALDGLAQSVACGNDFDAGPLWQLVDDSTKTASEGMEEIGELGVIELHHDIVVNVAAKLLKDGYQLRSSTTVPVLSNLAAKLMVSVWIRHELGKLPRTEETYIFVSDSLADDVAEAAQEIAAQIR